MCFCKLIQRCLICVSILVNSFPRNIVMACLQHCMALGIETMELDTRLSFFHLVIIIDRKATTKILSMDFLRIRQDRIHLLRPWEFLSCKMEVFYLLTTETIEFIKCDILERPMMPIEIIFLHSFSSVSLSILQLSTIMSSKREPWDEHRFKWPNDASELAYPYLTLPLIFCRLTNTWICTGILLM